MLLLGAQPSPFGGGSDTPRTAQDLEVACALCGSSPQMPHHDSETKSGRPRASGRYPPHAIHEPRCTASVGRWRGRPAGSRQSISYTFQIGGRFLSTPADCGGSFGVKQAVFPCVILIGVAARAAGRPVKWIEDRLEHLTASVSATNRVTRLEAAVEQDGRVLALAWDQIEDVGAHIRAPEPATLYRMHGNLTGAYDIRHVAVRNRSCWPTRRRRDSIAASAVHRPITRSSG